MRLSAIGFVLTLTLGILAGSSQERREQRGNEALQQGLRALRYVEGKNILLEYRFAEGKPERLPALAVELVRLKVDVMLIDDGTACRVAQHATETMPIVCTGFFDAVDHTYRTQIVDLAAQTRLPGLFPEREFAEAGGLMAYGSNIPAILHRAATYMDKILKGAKPAALPVEQPTKFELVINLKTAQSLGLTIPPMLLFQANEVIR